MKQIFSHEKSNYKIVHLKLSMDDSANIQFYNCVQLSNLILEYFSANFFRLILGTRKLTVVRQSLVKESAMRNDHLII